MENIKLDGLVLASGGHSMREQGVCLLEAVAWMAGENHSDHPACVCPVLGALGRRVNDRLPDDLRQQLIPLVPHMIGTRGDGLTVKRAFFAARWVLTFAVPYALDAVGETDYAGRLRALELPLEPGDHWVAARILSREARDKMRAAYWTVAVAAVAVAAAAAAAAAADAAAAAAADAADARRRFAPHLIEFLSDVVYLDREELRS